MGFFGKAKKSTPKLGTCKVVRGRGGKRTLCYTGKGLTGWQFKAKGAR